MKVKVNDCFKVLFLAKLLSIFHAPFLHASAKNDIFQYVPHNIEQSPYKFRKVYPHYGCQRYKKNKNRKCQIFYALDYMIANKFTTEVHCLSCCPDQMKGKCQEKNSQESSDEHNQPETIDDSFDEKDFVNTLLDQDILDDNFDSEEFPNMLIDRDILSDVDEQELLSAITENNDDSSDEKVEKRFPEAYLVHDIVDLTKDSNISENHKNQSISSNEMDCKENSIACPDYVDLCGLEDDEVSYEPVRKKNINRSKFKNSAERKSYFENYLSRFSDLLIQYFYQDPRATESSMLFYYEESIYIDSLIDKLPPYENPHEILAKLIIELMTWYQLNTEFKDHIEVQILGRVESRTRVEISDRLYRQAELYICQKFRTEVLFMFTNQARSQNEVQFWSDIFLQTWDQIEILVRRQIKIKVKDLVLEKLIDLGSHNFENMALFEIVQPEIERTFLIYQVANYGLKHSKEFKNLHFKLSQVISENLSIEKSRIFVSRLIDKIPERHEGLFIQAKFDLLRRLEKKLF